MPAHVKPIDLTGTYNNEAVVLTPRRDTPRERVTLSGLRFPMAVTAKAGPISSVRIVQRLDELQLEFLDAKGNVALRESITQPDHSVVLGSDEVTFADFKKGTSPELGKVSVARAFKLKLDVECRLIVEMTLNYSRTTLFVIPVSGSDRAVYSFARIP